MLNSESYDKQGQIMLGHTMKISQRKGQQIKMFVWKEDESTVV
jgi:hypothetical protein